MSEQKKAVTRVKLVEARTQNSTLYEIPQFSRRPEAIVHHNKVYLPQSDVTYVEVFAFHLSFNAEPVK